MAKRKSTSATTPATPSTKRTRSNSPPSYSQAVVFDELEIPYIRLRGFWLAAAGFEPADTLKVTVSKGRIVISRR